MVARQKKNDFCRVFHSLNWMPLIFLSHLLTAVNDATIQPKVRIIKIHKRGPKGVVIAVVLEIGLGRGVTIVITSSSCDTERLSKILLPSSVAKHSPIEMSVTP